MTYIDFDRMMAEMERSGPVVRVFGEEVRCRELPARIVLRLIRCDEQGSVPPDLLLDAAAALFGREALDGWLAREEFTLGVLAELVKQALAAGGQQADEDASEEPAGEPKNR